jgi:hypothetical protein
MSLKSISVARRGRRLGESEGDPEAGGQDCRRASEQARQKVGGLCAPKLATAWRVNKRTVGPSRRTTRRQPSCLISCTQSALAGGLTASVGTQGAMNPSSRNPAGRTTNR